MNFDANPIILHVFSNGGAYLYQHIDLAIKEFQTPLDVSAQGSMSLPIWLPSDYSFLSYFWHSISDLWNNIRFISWGSPPNITLSCHLVHLWQRPTMWLHYFLVHNAWCRCQMGGWGKTCSLLAILTIFQFRCDKRLFKLFLTLDDRTFTYEWKHYFRRSQRPLSTRTMIWNTLTITSHSCSSILM